MNKKLNVIKLKRGQGKELAKAFNCTPARVSQALNGIGAEDLTKKIRHVALKEYGGVELSPVNSTN